MKSIKDILFALVLAVCLIFFIKTYIIDFKVVASESMEPTLEKGDIIIISKLAYDIIGIEYNVPKSSDIITFNHNNEHLIKRIKDVNSQGKMFVIGDNENNSIDSRNFGYVRKSDLEGKAIIKFNFSTFSVDFLNE